jgi:hypothetical protein
MGKPCSNGVKELFLNDRRMLAGVGLIPMQDHAAIGAVLQEMEEGAP